MCNPRPYPCPIAINTKIYVLILLIITPSISEKKEEEFYLLYKKIVSMKNPQFVDIIQNDSMNSVVMSSITILLSYHYYQTTNLLLF